MRDLHHAAWLMAVTELLPAEWRDLSHLLETGQFERLVKGDAHPGSPLMRHLREHLQQDRVACWQERLEILATRHPHLRLTTVIDSEYPSMLRQTRERPPFLFVDGAAAGDLSRSAAIVGSRRASTTALDAAYTAAAQLAGQGVAIVSGLAEGVDSAAHAGALDAGGITAAVLGTGIDLVFPESNHNLAARVGASGCLVSQFRPGSPPTRSSFPMRNAVISGMSQVSILIEGAYHSGTFSEAEHAMRQGRPVLFWAPTMAAQPWAVDLVRDGAARFVDSIDEIMATIAHRGSTGCPQVT